MNSKEELEWSDEEEDPSLRYDLHLQKIHNSSNVNKKETPIKNITSPKSENYKQNVSIKIEIPKTNQENNISKLDENTVKLDDDIEEVNTVPSTPSSFSRNKFLLRAKSFSKLSRNISSSSLNPSNLQSQNKIIQEDEEYDEKKKKKSSNIKKVKTKEDYMEEYKKDEYKIITSKHIQKNESYSYSDSNMPTSNDLNSSLSKKLINMNRTIFNNSVHVQDKQKSMNSSLKLAQFAYQSGLIDPVKQKSTRLYNDLHFIYNSKSKLDSITNNTKKLIFNAGKESSKLITEIQDEQLQLMLIKTEDDLVEYQKNLKMKDENEREKEKQALLLKNVEDREDENLNAKKKKKLKSELASTNSALESSDKKKKLLKDLKSFISTTSEEFTQQEFNLFNQNQNNFASSSTSRPNTAESLAIGNLDQGSSTNLHPLLRSTSIDNDELVTKTNEEVLQQNKLKKIKEKENLYNINLNYSLKHETNEVFLRSLNENILSNLSNFIREDLKDELIYIWWKNCLLMYSSTCDVDGFIQISSLNSILKIFILIFLRYFSIKSVIKNFNKIYDQDDYVSVTDLLELIYKNIINEEKKILNQNESSEVIKEKEKIMKELKSILNHKEKDDDEIITEDLILFNNEENDQDKEKDNTDQFLTKYYNNYQKRLERKVGKRNNKIPLTYCCSQSSCLHTYIPSIKLNQFNDYCQDLNEFNQKIMKNNEMSSTLNFLLNAIEEENDDEEEDEKENKEEEDEDEKSIENIDGDKNNLSSSEKFRLKIIFLRYQELLQGKVRLKHLLSIMKEANIQIDYEKIPPQMWFKQPGMVIKYIDKTSKDFFQFLTKTKLISEKKFEKISQFYSSNVVPSNLSNKNYFLLDSKDAKQKQLEDEKIKKKLIRDVPSITEDFVHYIGNNNSNIIEPSYIESNSSFADNNYSALIDKKIIDSNSIGESSNLGEQSVLTNNSILMKAINLAVPSQISETSVKSYMTQEEKVKDNIYKDLPINEILKLSSNQVLLNTTKFIDQNATASLAQVSSFKSSPGLLLNNTTSTFLNNRESDDIYLSDPQAQLLWINYSEFAIENLQVLEKLIIFYRKYEPNVNQDEYVTLEENSEENSREDSYIYEYIDTETNEKIVSSNLEEISSLILNNSESFSKERNTEENELRLLNDDDENISNNINNSSSNSNSNVETNSLKKFNKIINKINEDNKKNNKITKKIIRKNLFHYKLPHWLKSQFKTSEILLYQHLFSLIDQSGDGSIDAEEVQALLSTFGKKVTLEDVSSIKFLSLFIS